MSLRPSREVAFPFHIGQDGGIAYVEDPYKAYFQHIVVTLMTMPGERLMVPEFGTRAQEYVFEPLEVASAELVVFVRQALERWEPSVAIQDVTPSADWGEGQLLITIEFTVPPRQEVLTTTIDVGGVVGAPSA